MGKNTNAYRIFMVKLEGKPSLGRPRRERTILEWILDKEDG
jgi:hypothetical protein